MFAISLGQISHPLGWRRTMTNPTSALQETKCEHWRAPKRHCLVHFRWLSATTVLQQLLQKLQGSVKCLKKCENLEPTHTHTHKTLNLVWYMPWQLIAWWFAVLMGCDVHGSYQLHSTQPNPGDSAWLLRVHGRLEQITMKWLWQFEQSQYVTIFVLPSIYGTQ